MSFLPSLRKTLRPSPKAIVPGEVKSVAGWYFDDLRRSLSAQTGRQWDVERAIREGYERIVWVFRPVNVIAENQRARKFQLKQGEAVVDDHPLVRLLNKKANPLESGPVLRKRLSAQILLSRPGAFVEVSKTRGGDPFRLDLLPPHRVRIVPGNKDADPRELTSLVDHYELIEEDGIRCRPIEPDNIRWFRDPHPLDPYSGITPLEAAGLSVELDHFARLYNVLFLRNDGRPGGIVAVKGDLDDPEMDRIERKFDKGVTAAGKLTVLSADGIEFIDPSAKPRDMSYAQLAKNAKIELLASFGVPETMMGYAGDKTFANAEQERLVFWQDTMPPHLSIIVDGFDEDSDDDLEGSFDLSTVEVLEKVKDAKLARAREEVAAGLRSPLSYARMAGITDIDDTIHTRSLYLQSGKTPLPINEQDAEAMGLGEQQDSGSGASGGASSGSGSIQPPDAAPAPPAAPSGPINPGGSPEGATPAGPGAAAAALAAATANPVGPAAPGSAAAALAALQSKGGKVVFRVVGKDDGNAWSSDDTDETARDQLEQAVRDALDALVGDWLERATARMSSVKSRKGTRHWNPQGDRPVDTRVDVKALDPAYAIDDDAWASESEEKINPILVAAALVAAERTWSNLGGAGRMPDRLTRRATKIAGEATTFVTGCVHRLAARLMQAINDNDQAGMSMPKIVEAVLALRGRLGSWSEAVAIQAATATTEGSRSLAARALANPADTLARDDDAGLPALPGGQPAPPAPVTDAEPVPNAGDGATAPGDAQPPMDVVQTWRTRRDDRVRPSHKAADGQRQPVGGLFEVGGYLLRFPGDPLAPPSETRNCRCTVNYRSRRTGRFAPKPAQLPLEAAQ